MEDLSRQLARCDKKVQSLEKLLLLDDPVLRVLCCLLARRVFSYTLRKVPETYYSLTLEDRARILGCQKDQLCKSIIFENTLADSEDYNDVSDPTNSRFYCVVVPYTAKFDAELLRDLIHVQRPVGERLPRKRFHFQLAKEVDSDKLSGFTHNAVSPIGMRIAIPVVMCRRCMSVSSPYIFMGGGLVDVKLGISLEDFVRVTKPIIGLVTHIRAEHDMDVDK